jgi:hypothetical protein
MNRSHRGEIDGAPAPTRNDEHHLHQTLVGTLPSELDEARLRAYRERIDAYDTAADLSFLSATCRVTDALSATSFDLDPRRPLALAQALAHFPAAILHGRLPTR